MTTVRGVDLPDDLIADVQGQDVNEVLLVSLMSLTDIIVAANKGERVKKEDTLRTLAGLQAALMIKLDQLFPEA